MSDQSESATAYLLHNPGCGVKGEICSPHPCGPVCLYEFYSKNPEMLVPVFAIVGLAVGIVLVQRRRKNVEP